jgi:hypothetical protein
MTDEELKKPKVKMALIRRRKSRRRVWKLKAKEELK